MNMKHLLLALLLLLQPKHALAQALPIGWQHCYGGSADENASAICIGHDGNYIIAGSTYSYAGDISGIMHGSADCWIIKVDTNGILLWERTLGGALLDRAYDIQPATDGGYIFAGFTYSNSDDVGGNHGSSDGWLVKLDDTGAIVWQKCLGGSSNEGFYTVLQTNDGGYFAVGSTSSADGDVVGYHGGSLADMWAVKTNDTGGIEWQKPLGGSNGAIGRSAIQTSDSGFLIAGYTISTDGDITGNHGGVDSWIVKLNKSGNLVWQKCYGGSYLDGGLSICPAIGGGYIFAGQTASVDGDVSHFYGGDLNGGDVWVVRIDDTGAILWEKSYGGSGNEIANSIRTTTDNNYIIAGWTESHDGDVSGRKDTTDAWVLVINDTGTVQWQKCLGGSNRELAFDIIQTNDNGLLVTGVSSSADSDLTFNHGLSDIWLVKLGISTTAIPRTTQLALQLYPNPTSDGRFVLQGQTSATRITVDVTDQLGRQVYSHIVPVTKGVFSEAISLPVFGGLYFVRIISDDEARTLPLIVR
jgi:hypothetical protein